MIHVKKINILAAKGILVLFLFLKVTAISSQVHGCTDPGANNYNSLATINDGSCTYNEVFYKPPVMLDSISYILKESSGLVWAGNSAWSFNDRGGQPELYRIDTAGNTILQTITLTGATNVDWEEATFDSTYFYVGDFGNSEDGARTDLKIYKFPFSSIPDHVNKPNAIIPAEQIEVINFTYSDQVQPPIPGALDSTRFDCEAMIVTGGKIHLFTKNWIDLTSTHYVINSTSAGAYVAIPLETLNTGYLVTGASKAPGEELVVLLGYENSGFGNHYLHLLSDYQNGNYFNGNKRKINLPGASDMGQAEGIAFRNGGYGYISNEKFRKSFGPVLFNVDQKLRSFNTADFIPSIVLAKLNDFSVTKINAGDEITWNFNIPVHHLEVQHSFDGLSFSTIKTYDISAKGSFTNKPIGGNNHYRMAWKQNDGRYKYSKIISIKNQTNKLISTVILKASGELSFIFNGSEPEHLAFKLFSIDGKELAKIEGHSYKPGINQIIFTAAYLDNIVLLAVNGRKQEITTLLPVLK